MPSIKSILYHSKWYLLAKLEKEKSRSLQYRLIKIGFKKAFWTIWSTFSSLFLSQNGLFTIKCILHQAKLLSWLYFNGKIKIRPVQAQKISFYKGLVNTKSMPSFNSADLHSLFFYITHLPDPFSHILSFSYSSNMSLKWKIYGGKKFNNI